MISILGSPLWGASAFFFVQGLILKYPSDLQYPNLWGTVAALCVLLLPMIFAEVFALSIAKSAPRVAAICKVIEVTCWLGAVGAILVPAVFCVTQDVGHIAIILFQVTTASIFASGALFTRICQQSGNGSPFAKKFS